MDDHRIDRVARAMAGPLSRRKMLKLVGGTVAGGAAVAAGVNLKSASAQGVLDIPINFVSRFGSFVGIFAVEEFVAQGGRLLAVGTLTGDVFDAEGDLIGPIDPQELTLPVRQTTSASCQILHLELGPLNLNLLGLRVQLNRVVLDITAEPGSLLGDLLCAIANLLSGGGPLSGLTTLLNELLGLLGGV